MPKEKHIPTTEFEIMKYIWAADAEGIPVTTGYLMEVYGTAKGWKAPTLITLLNRLAYRGLLESTKGTKLRQYHPLVSEQEYLRTEVGEVAGRYEGRLAGLFCALAERDLSDADAEELLNMLDGKDMKK